MKKMNLQDVILDANYNEQIDEVVRRGEERERGTQNPTLRDKVCHCTAIIRDDLRVYNIQQDRKKQEKQKQLKKL